MATSIWMKWTKLFLRLNCNIAPGFRQMLYDAFKKSQRSTVYHQCHIKWLSINAFTYFCCLFKADVVNRGKCGVIHNFHWPDLSVCVAQLGSHAPGMQHSSLPPCVCVHFMSYCFYNTQRTHSNAQPDDCFCTCIDTHMHRWLQSHNQTILFWSLFLQLFARSDLWP